MNNNIYVSSNIANRWWKANSQQMAGFQQFVSSNQVSATITVTGNFVFEFHRASNGSIYYSTTTNATYYLLVSFQETMLFNLSNQLDLFLVRLQQVEFQIQVMFLIL